MSILQIDRSVLFQPSHYPPTGNKGKVVEQDQRSLRLTELNLEEIPVDEYYACVDRFNGMYLDAGVLMALCQNPLLFPDRWKGTINGKKITVFFKGTVIQSMYGTEEFESLYVLGIWWSPSLKNVFRQSYWLDEWNYGDGRRLVEEIRSANQATLCPV